MNGDAAEQVAKVNYGLDAPGFQRGALLGGLAGVFIGIALLACNSQGYFHAGSYVASTLLWTGGWFVLTAIVMFWGSKIGKLRLRDKIIASIPWRGDEMVLDVGCGHGLMLLASAKRLTSGKAIGIDIWSQVDQADNSMEATLHNAALEGVADRVEVKNADARKLPFPDNTFDVVVSSFAIHNMKSAADRKQAIVEIARVLKPDGELAIADIQQTRQYQTVLRSLGWSHVRRWFPNFIFVTPTRVLRATKPSA